VRGLSLAVVVAMLAIAQTAAAHDRSVSYSSWESEGDRVEVRVEMSARVATALPTGDPAGAVAGSFALRRGEAACVHVPGSLTSLSPAPDARRFEWTLVCPAAGGAHELTVDLLFERLAGHLHIAAFGAAEHVFAGTTRTARWQRGGAPAPVMVRLGRYARLGVSHVLGGLDHLIFLLALVVVARSVREVAVVATGFTVGHSLTLALAVSGRVVPEGAAIEALIGLSIVLVAVDNVWMHGSGSRRARAAAAVVLGMAVVVIAGGAIPRATMVGCAVFAACYLALAGRSEHPARLRLAAAGLFGLVHGFGFAAALADLSASAGLALPVVGFNLGVELGQLLIIACTYPLVALAVRRGQRQLTVDLASAGAVAAGLFWFLSRNFA
jgi:hypothetical protein